MAPKGKGGEKSADKGGKKGKGKADAEEKGGKVKGAQQINCEKHSKKEEALAKLKDGAKFDEVAREFSEDKARAGGALGWKSRGDLDPTFEAMAFDLEASTTGNPKIAEAKTGFGYHIIMVEGRK